jgi:hypothetical protein
MAFLFVSLSSFLLRFSGSPDALLFSLFLCVILI